MNIIKQWFKNIWLFWAVNFFLAYVGAGFSSLVLFYIFSGGFNALAFYFAYDSVKFRADLDAVRKSHNRYER